MSTLQAVVSIEPKRYSTQMDHALDYSYVDAPVRPPPANASSGSVAAQV